MNYKNKHGWKNRCYKNDEASERIKKMLKETIEGKRKGPKTYKKIKKKDKFEYLTIIQDSNFVRNIKQGLVKIFIIILGLIILVIFSGIMSFIFDKWRMS